MPDRRRVLTTGAAAALTLTGLPPALAGGSPPRGPLLLRGGLLVTAVPGQPAQVGDVRIDNSRITAVGPDLAAAGAHVVDCRGAIVTPAWVDTHVHGWERLLRYRATALSFGQYLGTITGQYLSRYTTADIALGERLEALAALDAGIGTITSWCHAIRSRDDALAAVHALTGTGIGLVFLHGYNSLRFGPGAGPNLADAEVTIAEARACGARGTGIAVVGPEFTPDLTEVTEQVRFADEQRCLLSLHDGIPGFHDARPGVALMARAGLLRRNQLHVHGVALTDQELAAIASVGAGLSVSPAVDVAAFGAVLPYDRARRAGVTTAVSSDDVAYGAGLRDHVAAWWRDQHRSAGPAGALATADDMLAAVTRDAAAAVGLLDVGQLRRGYRADVCVIDTGRLDIGPVAPATAAAAVLAAPAAAVRHVLVGGQWRKHGGRLVGVDAAALLEQAAAAAARITAG